MSAVSTLPPTIGWRSDDTATGDPRAPRRVEVCGWCNGGRAILERVEFGMPWDLIPVRCPNCQGRGVVLIARPLHP